MNGEITILIVEDDDGHARLAERNLRRTGITNGILRFRSGEEVLDYLFDDEGAARLDPGRGFVLLLDIRMPGIGGLEVLRRVKGHAATNNIPVIMLTTTDDEREVEECHAMGCNAYVTKPVDHEGFVEVLRRLGLFLLVLEVPPAGVTV